MPTTDLKILNTVRAAFMRKVSAPDLNSLALKLAYLIAYKYLNNETGTARPSQDTLAHDLNVSIRTVQRVLDILQPLGLVIVPGHGPDRASTYWIDPDKATPVSPINTTPMSPIGGRKGDKRRQRTRHLTTKYTTPMSPQLKKKNQEEEPREESKTLAPDFASPDSKQDTPPKPDRKTKTDNVSLDRKTGRKRKPKASAHGDNVTMTDPDSAFAEFWSAYPRKKDKQDARKAFAAAIKRGATPAAMIAAAKRYAIERSGQPEKYTKHPATWLNKGSYDDEPGDGLVIDQDGNPIDTPPRRSAPQTDEELVEELLREGGKDWT